jgi:hypothetical protein
MIEMYLRDNLDKICLYLDFEVYDTYLVSYIYSEPIYNKAERLLFISGLKYKNYYDPLILCVIFLYTKDDFDKYMQMWKLLYPKTKSIHNKNEVIKFFENK